MPKRLPTPKGYRKLKPGEIIGINDVFWTHGNHKNGLSQGTCRPSIGRSWPIDTTQTQYYRATKSTQKPKEHKTMTATKKPGTSHGKPTAKGLRVENKPTAAKVSKYPAPRVQITALVPVKSLDKMTKLELIETYYALRDQFDNQAADHCIAGTKLDRALVDLKEAKKRIKELTKNDGVAK